MHTYAMYCGIRHDRRELSRDHVTPLSQGGEDAWKNVRDCM